MKIISWNIVSLRALLKKNPNILNEMVEGEAADILCLQETKLQDSHTAEMVTATPKGFRAYWSCSRTKKGYSGVAVFVSERLAESSVVSVSYTDPTDEGRVITMDFGTFYLVNCYVPNSGQSLERLGYRTTEWDSWMRAYLTRLVATRKHVILAGDLNVGHGDLDMYKPSPTVAGMTPEERAGMTALLGCGFRDVFRWRNPSKSGAFTYWSYMLKAREPNRGYRIDYFICSESMFGSMSAPNSWMLYEETYKMSDHCPIVLTF